MKAKTVPSESESMLVLVVVLVHEWLLRNAPEATIRAESEPGDWKTINLVDACAQAMADFRAEHGGMA